MSRKKIVDKSFFGGRLKFVREHMNLTQAEFSNKIGTSSGQISEVESGKKMPRGDFFLSLLREFGVSSNWLLTGEGEPFLRETFAPPKTLVGQLQRPTAKQAPIYNEGEEAKWNDVSLGRAVDQLQKIYDSGDATLIRAINANLDAFTRTVDLADEVKSLKVRMAAMETTIERLEKIIDELGRREECCVHAVATEGPSPEGDPQ